MKVQFYKKKDNNRLNCQPNGDISQSSKQNRTRIRSFGDVLNVIKDSGRDGVIVSIISRRANLAHYSTLEKCNQLISAGLIESKIHNEKKTYLITGVGLEFLQEYENFQKLVEPLNLKY